MYLLEDESVDPQRMRSGVVISTDTIAPFTRPSDVKLLDARKASEKLTGFDVGHVPVSVFPTSVVDVQAVERRAQSSADERNVVKSDVAEMQDSQPRYTVTQGQQ